MTAPKLIRPSNALWLSGWCVLLLALALLAHADTGEAGRVVIASGEVHAVAADGSRRALGRGDPVFEADTLITGATGRVQLRFSDDSRLALRPGSELRIDAHRFQPAEPPQTQRSNLSLQRGGFRTVTGQIAATNRDGYRVATPFAVIGVRGTEWFADIVDLGQGDNLLLGVESGTIFAENDGGSLDLGADADFSFAIVTSFDSIPEGLESLPEGFEAPPIIDLAAVDAPLDDTTTQPPAPTPPLDDFPVVVIGIEASQASDLILLLTTEAETDTVVLQIQPRCL